MNEYEVNIDRGLELDGKHFPLGARVFLPEKEAAELLKKGWIVAAPEPEGPGPAAFVKDEE